MGVDNHFEQCFQIVVMDLEGGAREANIEGDRGGVTRFGIASSVWPEEYAEIAANGWQMRDVKKFYFDNFYSRIPAYRQLARTAPSVLFLLFSGKVHGTGIRDYTSGLQVLANANGFRIQHDGLFGPRTASVLRQMASQWGDKTVVDALNQWRDDFARLRVASVGLPSVAEGIRNRVYRELEFARSLT